jgi:polyisoprenoid-binding protein YceI
LSRYQIDKGSGRFTVRAFATGLLSALGHSPTIAIRDFSGEAVFDPAKPEESSLQVRIKADSLEVMDDISNKDRREMEQTMKQEILQSATYPEIVYASSGVSATPIGEGRWQINMNGNVTLRGVTRAQAVSAQVTLGGDTLRAAGEFTLLQSTYGINPVSVAGGTLKLKDELKFTFDIVARNQE